METRGEKSVHRKDTASLHGSTNVQKVCRIHQGRGHLSRRPLTSRAFNARVHSSIYIYIHNWEGDYANTLMWRSLHNFILFLQNNPDVRR